MKEKIAIPLEGAPSIVLLDNGERMTRAKALAAGYRIVDAAAVKNAEVANSVTDAVTRWCVAIECLPEARDRESATAELIASRNPETLTIEQARAFLRGLPTETEETESTEMTTDENDPRAPRRAEIAASMSAFNRERGYRAAQVRVPQPAALSNAEPVKLKRLAEIRLNALHMNGNGHSQEAKSLKVALDTHNSVGTPLNRALAQLGIDASKFAS